MAPSTIEDMFEIVRPKLYGVCVVTRIQLHIREFRGDSSSEDGIEEALVVRRRKNDQQRFSLHEAQLTSNIRCGHFRRYSERIACDFSAGMSLMLM